MAEVEGNGCTYFPQIILPLYTDTAYLAALITPCLVLKLAERNPTSISSFLAGCLSVVSIR